MALTYERVGYHGGEFELEGSFALEVRRARFEAGANAVFGQSLAEARRAGRSDLDFQGGGIASLTVGEWQFGTLVGASTLGLHERVGLLAELFGTVRFGGRSSRPRS